jgi:hypothetical protein
MHFYNHEQHINSTEVLMLEILRRIQQTVKSYHHDECHQLTKTVVMSYVMLAGFSATNVRAV